MPGAKKEGIQPSPTSAASRVESGREEDTMIGMSGVGASVKVIGPPELPASGSVIAAPSYSSGSPANALRITAT